MFRIMVFLIFLVSFAIADQDKQWILISNVNNEPEYWDVWHIKYSVVPDSGGVIIYVNLKSVYTYYNKTFTEKPSPTIGIATQLNNSFIFEACQRYKAGKPVASAGISNNTSDIKTLCSLKANDKFYRIIYQGAMLIKDGRLYPISPPVVDLSMYIYVNNLPVFSLTTKADPVQSKPIDLYTISSPKPDLTDKYNTMVDTINTYIIPQINNNSSLNISDLDKITSR